MALDILLITAMSADPKRLFSSAKITIFNRRCRLGIPTIKALECLKSWLGIIKALEDDPKEDEEHINMGDTVDEVVKVNTSKGG
jgi:hypothetical protein